MARRFFIPEVVQTSAMDCGPAALKCLFEGFRIPVNYARLREICHTDVDGTSISVIESVANQLGLPSEEIMVPADHVLLESSSTTPCIAVIRLPNGATHFVVLWRRHGTLCQVMDPAAGRVWRSVDDVRRSLYEHKFVVPAAAWREWVASTESHCALGERLRALGIGELKRRELIDGAAGDETWKSFAVLDAAVRFVAALRREQAVRTAPSIAALIDQLIANASLIPEDYWSVTGVPSDEAGSERLRLKGAILMRVRPGAEPDAVSARRGGALSSALDEEPRATILPLLRMLREDGFLNAGLAVVIALVQAFCVVGQAFLFRGLFGSAAQVMTRMTRLEQLAGVIAFAVLALLATLPGTMSVLRWGRLLENRLRLALYRRVPHLRDRYFQSRLTADVAERSHAVHLLRTLPQLALQIIGSSLELLLMTLGIIWLDPSVAPLALLTLLCAVLVPLAMQPALQERDLRVRSHLGALARFYLESMRGLAAIRAHSAERAIRFEQETRLREWSYSALSLVKGAMLTEGLQLSIGSILAAIILLRHLSDPSDVGQSLLLVFWALSLPAVGTTLAAAARLYPAHRNVALRLLEPLTSPDVVDSGEDSEPATFAEEGVAIDIDRVTVRAAGHEILADVNLSVAARTHVAIVGPSGAGKSTLLGLLLGWQTAAAGEVRANGTLLDESSVAALRAYTAWVDPAIQLWNTTLLDNIQFSVAQPNRDLSFFIEQADLLPLLQTLPDGFQTVLGESGNLVSGGEGQRVRLARAMARGDARLVILDEPFRGLDAGKRRLLLDRARTHWSEATLLCVTHDVHDTLSFPRVIVLDHGRIVEDGSPSVLAACDGLYAKMLAEETKAKLDLKENPTWRRIAIEGGKLIERS